MRPALTDALAKVAVRAIDAAHAVAQSVLDGISTAGPAGEIARDEARAAREADLRAEIAARGDGPLVEADALFGRLRAHLAALAAGRAPLTVHERLRAMQALGLSPRNVLVVLGAAPDVESYFEARAAGRHDVAPGGVCRICGARPGQRPCVPP